MVYVGWVKDARLISFGQKPYFTSSNFVFETKKEAKDAARSIVINDKKIFEFVWDFIDSNGFDEMQKVFPEIYEFDNFEERFASSDRDQNDEFEDELIKLDNFDKFVDLYPFLTYGYCKVKDFESLKKEE